MPDQNPVPVPVPKGPNLVGFIEQFSGEKKEDINDFLERVDLAATVGGWSEAQKLGIAKMSMKGKARLYLAANAEVKALANWDEFVATLKSKFKRKEPQVHAEKRFRECVQGDKESVEDFATRLMIEGQNLVKEGATAAETALRKTIHEEGLLAQFLSGLRISIRRPVLSRSPAIFSAAIEIAEEEESNELLAPSPAPVTSSVYFTRGNQNQNNYKGKGNYQNSYQGNQHYQNSSNGNFQKTPSQTECFNCGGFGHMKHACRNPHRPKCNNCGKRGHHQKVCRGNSQETRGDPNGQRLPTKSQVGMARKKD